jgi:hypothetical protein
MLTLRFVAIYPSLPGVSQNAEGGAGRDSAVQQTLKLLGKKIFFRSLYG